MRPQPMRGQSTARPRPSSRPIGSRRCKGARPLPGWNGARKRPPSPRRARHSRAEARPSRDKSWRYREASRWRCLARPAADGQHRLFWHAAPGFAQMHSAAKARRLPGHSGTGACPPAVSADVGRQRRLDASEQFVLLERLDQIAENPVMQRAVANPVVGVCGDQDGRNAPPPSQTSGDADRAHSSRAC